MIGVAVGLGNVWRFPYMMGKYGGSAFLFVYLIFTLMIALPALMSEISLGRSTRKGPMGAFNAAVGPLKGRIIGYILLITILVASSYYAVVIANVVYASFFSITQGFQSSNLTAYNTGLGNGHVQYLITVGIILSSLFVIHRGLSKGIEWVSKVFVPFFLVVILFLIYHAFTLEGAWDHIVAFLRPDFAAFKPVNLFAALGQAIYSLSLGGTFMVVYGSYLDDNVSIAHIAKWTAIGDVGAALLASLFIVPAILVYQLDMTAGPTLIFSTLPHLFSEMDGGQWIGSLFLTALSCVAFLSLVGALEVAQTCFKELRWLNWNKGTILIVIGLIEIILAYPNAMDSNLIGILDMIFGSGMQVIGSGLALIALTWSMGKAVTYFQLSTISNKRWMDLLFLWMKWAIPLILLFVLIGYIYNIISGL
jgi:NSS family neurotransmitter:Na+ symporter